MGKSRGTLVEWSRSLVLPKELIGGLMVESREYFLCKARHAIARARLFRSLARWASVYPSELPEAIAILEQRAIDKYQAALLWRAVAHRASADLRLLKSAIPV